MEQTWPDILSYWYFNVNVAVLFAVPEVILDI